MTSLKRHYWCSRCHIPLLRELCLNCGERGVQIKTDLKPVFLEEHNYYKEIAETDPRINKKFFPKILYRNKNRLISDGSKGKTHYKIKIRENISDDKESLNSPGKFDIYLLEVLQHKRSTSNTFFLDNQEYINILIKGNLYYLEEIEEEAINFIKKTSRRFKNYYQICSFSGGKDSTVTAFLVKKAIGDTPIVFSDTGIEFPETIEYVKNHGGDFGKLIYLDSEVDFLKMCNKLGPPSRTMRWCCFTNKGAPISKFYSNLEHKNVLSFDGIRKDESNLRSNYPRDMDNTKYEKQYSTYPILNWTTLEVWLYIIWKKLPFNILYRYGFSRIGCWACPNNGKFDWYLLAKVHPEMVEEWISLIHKYKSNQIETMKKDKSFGENLIEYDHEWLEDGHWKSRRVKYHNIDNLVNIESPCGKHDFDLILKHPVDKNLLDYLKVFGNPTHTTLPTNQKMYRIINDDVIISFLENGKTIKFYIEDERKTQELKKLIFRQINKYFNCVNCGACVGSCPQGAISINPHFRINENKCVNCLICTGTQYLQLSCVAIHYKEERILINLKKN